MTIQPDPLSFETADATPDRESARRSFFLTTALVSEPHGTLAARVRNLSAGGMMVELPEEPYPEIRPGHRVTAELRNIGRVRGEIAWADGRRLGMKFDRDVDPELARKPLVVGETTPDFVKPVLVPGRSLKYVEGLKGW